MSMQTGQRMNLALFNENNNFFVLFEPTVRFKLTLKTLNWEKAIQEQTFYAVAQVRDNTLYHAAEIDAVWARKGYGPLIYLLIMTAVGNYGLTANRINGQITPE